MLTKYITVDILRIDFIFVSENAAETVSFKHSAGAEDFLTRIIKLSAYDVDSNIKWVGDENDVGISGTLLNLIEDRAHNLSIGAGEFKSVRSLTWTN